MGFDHRARASHLCDFFILISSKFMAKFMAISTILEGKVCETRNVKIVASAKCTTNCSYSYMKFEKIDLTK